MLCEAPNDKVNDFLGKMCLKGHAHTLVSEENLLLRGCQLRNTDWCYGLVIACGTDTKVNFKGSGPAGADAVKAGHSETLINQQVFFLVLWLFTICVIGASAYNAFRDADKPGEPWCAPRSNRSSAAPRRTAA